MIGIYRIENLINHKCYIGQSKYIEKRWNRHRKEPFNQNSHSYNYPLYKAMRKYGIENFSFEVLEECDITELNEKEVYYIDVYNSFYNGYNQTVGGDASASVEKEKILGILNDLKTTFLSHSEIANRWNISIEMVQGINTGRYWKHNIEYPIQKRAERKKYFCVDCGKEITKGSTRCEVCAKIAHRKTERPTKEELLSILYQIQNFTHIGQKYNVSANMVKKWCRYYNISSSISDYKMPKHKKERAKGITYPQKVKMLDAQTNNILQTFDSMESAYKYLNVQSSSHISLVCRGKRKTAYGYKWAFAE